jgi:hypothetical protein
MVGDIISEWWAELSRNGWRHQSGIANSVEISVNYRKRRLEVRILSAGVSRRADLRRLPGHHVFNHHRNHPFHPFPPRRRRALIAPAVPVPANPALRSALPDRRH